MHGPKRGQKGFWPGPKCRKGICIPTEGMQHTLGIRVDERMFEQTEVQRARGRTDSRKRPTRAESLLRAVGL